MERSSTPMPGPSTADDITELLDVLGSPPPGSRSIFETEEFIEKFAELNAQVSESVERTLKDRFGNGYDLDNVINLMYNDDSTSFQGSQCSDEDGSEAVDESSDDEKIDDETFSESSWLTEGGNASECSKDITYKSTKKRQSNIASGQFCDSTILDLIQSLCSIGGTDDSDSDLETNSIESIFSGCDQNLIDENQRSGPCSRLLESSDITEGNSFSGLVDKDASHDLKVNKNNTLVEKIDNVSRNKPTHRKTKPEYSTEPKDIDCHVNLPHGNALKNNSLSKLGVESDLRKKHNEAPNAEQEEVQNAESNDNDLESPESPPLYERQCDLISVCREIPTTNLNETEEKLYENDNCKLNNSYNEPSDGSNSIPGMYESSHYTQLQTNVSNQSNLNIGYNQPSYPTMVGTGTHSLNNYSSSFSKSIYSESLVTSTQHIQNPTNIWSTKPGNLYQGYWGTNNGNVNNPIEGQAYIQCETKSMKFETHTDYPMSKNPQYYTPFNPLSNEPTLPKTLTNLFDYQKQGHDLHNPVIANHSILTPDNKTEQTWPQLTPDVKGSQSAEAINQEALNSANGNQETLHHEANAAASKQFSEQPESKSICNSSSLCYPPITPSTEAVSEFQPKDISESKQVGDNKTSTKRLTDELQFDSNSLYKEILKTIKDIDIFKTIIENKDKLTNTGGDSGITKLSSSNSTALPPNHDENSSYAPESFNSSDSSFNSLKKDFQSLEHIKCERGNNNMLQNIEVRSKKTFHQFDGKASKQSGKKFSVDQSFLKKHEFKPEESTNSFNEKYSKIDHIELERHAKNHHKEKQSNRSNSPIKEGRKHGKKHKDAMERKGIIHRFNDDDKLRTKKERFRHDVEFNYKLRHAINRCITGEIGNKNERYRFSDQLGKTKSQNEIIALKSAIGKGSHDTISNEFDIKEKHLFKKAKRSKKNRTPNPSLEKLKSTLEKELSMLENESETSYKMKKYNSKYSYTKPVDHNFESAPPETDENKDHNNPNSDIRTINDIMPPGTEPWENYSTKSNKVSFAIKDPRLKYSERVTSQFDIPETIKQATCKNNSKYNDCQNSGNNEDLCMFDNVNEGKSCLSRSTMLDHNTCSKEEDNYINGNNNYDSALDNGNALKCNNPKSEHVFLKLKNISNNDSIDDIRPPGTESWEDDFNSPTEGDVEKPIFDSKIEQSIEASKIVNKDETDSKCSTLVENSYNDLANHGVQSIDHTKIDCIPIPLSNLYTNDEKPRQTKSHIKEKDDWADKHENHNRSEDRLRMNKKSSVSKNNFWDGSSSVEKLLSCKIRSKSRTLSPLDRENNRYGSNPRDRHRSPFENKHSKYYRLRDKSFSPVERTSRNKHRDVTISPEKEFRNSHRSQLKDRSPVLKVRSKNSLKRMNSFKYESRNRSRSPKSKNRDRSRSPRSKNRDRSRSPWSKNRDRSISPRSRNRDRSRSPRSKNRDSSISDSKYSEKSVRMARKRSRSPNNRLLFRLRSPTSKTRSRSPSSKTGSRSPTSKTRPISPTKKTRSPVSKTCLRSISPMTRSRSPNKGTTESKTLFKSYQDPSADIFHAPVSHNVGSAPIYPSSWTPPINNNPGLGYIPYPSTVPGFPPVDVWPSHYPGVPPGHPLYQQPQFFAPQHYFS